MTVINYSPMNQKNPLVHSDVREREEEREKEREKKENYFFYSKMPINKCRKNQKNNNFASIIIMTTSEKNQ